MGKKIELRTGENKEESFFLSWGVTENAALKMPEVSKYDIKPFKPPEIRSGNKKTDLFCTKY